MTRSRIRWAPKISRQAIARLYHEELTGKIDLVAAENVGTAIFLRCEALKLYAAYKLRCPDCGTTFVFLPAGEGPDAKGTCPCCGWFATAKEYHDSRRHKDLNVANAMSAVDLFMSKYPACRDVSSLLVAIDQLIHAFHWYEKAGLPNRSLGNNLIEGNHREVVEFLDTLSAVDTNMKTEWRKTVGQMWRRRRNLP